MGETGKRIVNLPKTLLGTMLPYGIQAVVVLAIAFVSLRLYEYDFRVPLSYQGDCLVILMYIKGIILNGWTWNIPQLSAPYGMSAAAFPMLTSFDWLIMKGISVFTSAPGIILNSFWLLTLIFSAWTSTFAARLLKINFVYAFPIGILYAFLPFALLRNTHHLNLVYYLVPLLALLSVNLASGLTLDNDKKIRRIALVACVVQGFNYIYFSFFATILFGFSAILGYSTTRSRKVIYVAAAAIALIIVSTVANLSPGLYSWHKNGMPPEMEYKSPPEAEIYGVKIRKMLAPQKDNALPALGYWGRRDARNPWPNENENVTARLGAVGSLGFILLLLISLKIIRPAGDGDALLVSTAALSLFTLLVITVGGGGAIFNLLIAPDIRAYNRFSVFLSFFSFVGLACYLQEKYDSLAKKKWIVTALIVLFFVSLYDQLLDRYLLFSQRDPNVAQYKVDTDIALQLKRIYPNGATILQLPLIGFPLGVTHEKMLAYDHLRPFLWSDSSLHWSFPSFSERHRDWQNRISALDDGEIVNAAIYSRFNVILLDRYAYKDQGNALLDNLENSGAKRVFETERYAVLDLGDAGTRLRNELSEYEFVKRSNDWIGPVVPVWGSGFYGRETNPAGMNFRWSQKSSSLVIRNFSNHAEKVRLSFDIASQFSGQVVMKSGDNLWILNSNSTPSAYKFEFDVERRSQIVLNFEAKMPQVNAPGDLREMYFYIANFAVEDVSGRGMSL